jgi:outer membrane biosynthesis protein TonB
MTMTTPRHKEASRVKRTPLAIAISSASLGLIALTFAIGGRPEPAQPNASAEKQSAEPSTVWNLALGNVVVLAPELGFKTSAPAGMTIDSARVAARIQTQLTGLRQLYRQQSERDPALLGHLTVQLTVGSAGRVEDVTVLSGEMKDSEFRKAVAVEAGKWSIGEVAPPGTVIHCPLLFVREGMDITTVVNWEKILSGPGVEAGVR